jgi:hypothetical protein
MRRGITRVAGCMALSALTLQVVLSVPAYGAGGPGGYGRGGGRGSGSLGRGGVGVGIGVVGPATTPPGTTVPNAPPAPGTATTQPQGTSTTQPQGQWTFAPCEGCFIRGLVCSANAQLEQVPPGSPLPPGSTDPYDAFWIEPSGPGNAGYVCFPPAQAPAPPPQPSAAQVWESEALPEPEPRTDPGSYGIAQLPTWFWLDDDAASQDLVLPTVSLDGYSITLSVHPVGYRWTFGDGSSEQSGTAGSRGAAGASATHTYLQPGTYGVGVSVTWAGSYTFSGYGTTQTVGLGPVAQGPQTFRFVVQQVRSLLVSG